MNRLLVVTLLMISFSGCGTSQKKEQEIAQLHLRVGTAYLVQGKLPQALRELLIAEENDPQDPFIQNNLGITYFTYKKNKKALFHLKKAIALKDDYSDARNNLGRVYIEEGFFDQAIGELQRVISDLTYLSPNKAMVNLGLAYMRKGSLKEAEQSFLKALQVDRGSCLAHNYYGQTLLRQKRFDEASQSLDQAVSLCQELKFDEPHYYSGVAYLRLGEAEKARSRLKEVVELYPQGAYVKRARKQLQAIQKE